MGINLTREELNLLTELLDRDGDGHVSVTEFTDKVTLKDWRQKAAKYTISLKNFTDRVMNEWYSLHAEKKDEIVERI